MSLGYDRLRRAMNQWSQTGHRLSIGTRIVAAVLLPIATFMVYQLALIESTSGSGSWDGMSLFFVSIFIVPGLLIADCWAVLVRWRRRRTAYLAGLALPAVVGAIEYVSVHSTGAVRAALDQAFDTSPTLARWLVLGMFIPLVVSVGHVVLRRTRRAASPEER